MWMLVIALLSVEHATQKRIQTRESKKNKSDEIFVDMKLHHFRCRICGWMDGRRDSLLFCNDENSHGFFSRVKSFHQFPAATKKQRDDEIMNYCITAY